MWLVLVQLFDIPQPVLFRFRGRKPAADVFTRLEAALQATMDKQAPVTVADDYGHTRVIFSYHIHHIGLLDVDQDVAASADLAYREAKARQEAQSRLQSGPQLSIPRLDPGRGFPS